MTGGYTRAIHPRKAFVATALALAAVGLLLLIHLYRPTPRGLWFLTLYDALHGPVFGLVALCLYGITILVDGWSLARRVVIVLALSLLLGIASELAQIPMQREASLNDLMTDCLGAAGFLLLALAGRRSAQTPDRLRPSLAVGGCAALLVAFLPFLTVSAAYLERNARLPVLSEPRSVLGHVFWRRQNAVITKDEFDGAPAYRVSLANGAWPGMIFHDIWPDWRQYETLVLELGSGETEPLDVHFRVHDQLHRLTDQPYNDRYNGTFPLTEGTTELRIPLSTIRDAPAQRQMDLRSVDGMVLFCDGTNTGREFFVLGIRLE